MNVSTFAELHLAAGAGVMDLHAGLVAAGTDAEERDAVAVLRVHVRLDLEHETGERRLGGIDLARAAVARLRRRGPLDQRLQDFAHAEVVDAGAEEDRSLAAGEEGGDVERRARAADEVDVVQQRGEFVGEQLGEARIVEALDQLGVVADAFLAG